MVQRRTYVASPGNAGRRAAEASLEAYLLAVDYPASKQRIVEAARRDEAPPAIIQALGRLPERNYGRPMDVTNALALTRK